MADRLLQSPRIDANIFGQEVEKEQSSLSSEMVVAKLSAAPNLDVRFFSLC